MYIYIHTHYLYNCVCSWKLCLLRKPTYMYTYMMFLSCKL